MNLNLLALLVSCIVSFVAVFSVRIVRNHQREHRRVSPLVCAALLRQDVDRWVSSAWLDIALLEEEETVEPAFVIHLLRQYEAHGLVESALRTRPWPDGTLREIRFYRLTPDGRAHAEQCA